MGYLYQPKLKKRPGETEARVSSVWWCKYYVNGRPVRESTGAEKETEARRFLKQREGAAATGAPILPRMDRIRYEDIRKDLLEHYVTTGRRNAESSAGASSTSIDSSRGAAWLTSPTTSSRPTSSAARSRGPRTGPLIES